MGRNKQKTVFISYRRTNFWLALAIQQNLTHHGFDAFIDYDNIPSGDFEKVILENIKSRAHFVLVLTPSALERCKEPGDMLRKEIETAIEQKRNIVPLMVDNFDFGSPATKEALSGKLTILSKYQGLRVVADYFVEGMDRLRDKYLDVDLSDIFLPDLPAELQKATESQLVAAAGAPPVEKDQLTAQEWFERGFVFQEAKDLDEAIRCYTEVIRLQPDFARAYNNRGNARSDSGDLAGALGDYDEAIRLRPDNDFAYNNRGNARSRSGDIPGALADFDEAIRLKPDNAIAYNNRGVARRTKGNLAGALADYREAIRLKPDLDVAYSNRGNYYELKGDLETALKDFQAACQLNPRFFSAQTSQMSILRKLGREKEAKEQEKLARELIQPGDEYNQACFESLCGNAEEALRLLKIALEKGLSSKEWARQDPDFENLRGDARFEEMVR